MSGNFASELKCVFIFFKTVKRSLFLNKIFRFVEKRILYFSFCETFFPFKCVLEVVERPTVNCINQLRLHYMYIFLVHCFSFFYFICSEFYHWALFLKQRRFIYWYIIVQSLFVILCYFCIGTKYQQAQMRHTKFCWSKSLKIMNIV